MSNLTTFSHIEKFSDFWLTPLTVRSATHSQQPPERSVLSHAAGAWCGFTIADDRQRLEVVIRRGTCFKFCFTQ